MSLEIEIDPHGMRRVPFNEVRARLLATGQRFTEKDLRLLPYPEIGLAAIANAGAARCTLEEVVAHKHQRRYRFLHLSPDELPKSRRYLQIEQMYADVNAELRMRGALKWADLNPREQLWFKLNCIYNHIDNPDDRLHEASFLVVECGQDDFLSPGTAVRINEEIDRLRWLYPAAIDDETFRGAVGELAEEILGYLDDAEKEHCQLELVADYSCTSNCYRAMETPS